MLFNLVTLSLIYYKFVPKHLRLTFNYLFGILVFKFITMSYILFVWSDIGLTPIYLCASLHVFEAPVFTLLLFSIGYLNIRANLTSFSIFKDVYIPVILLFLSILLQIPLVLFIYGYGFTFLILYIIIHALFVVSLLSCKLNYLEGDERFLFIFVKYTLALYTQFVVVLNIIELINNPSPVLLNIYTMMCIVVYFLLFTSVFTIFHRYVVENKIKYRSQHQSSR